MIPDTDKAYIAGLFDGEGSVLFTRKNEKKKKHNGKGYRISNSMRINMEITMTDKSVIFWVHEVLGCGTVTRKPRKGLRKDGTKYLMQWRWRCTFRDAYYVCCMIWPWAHTKLPKIQQIIEHYTHQALDNKIISLEEYREVKKMLDKYIYQGLHFLMEWSGKINSWAWRKHAKILRSKQSAEMEALIRNQENSAYLEELKKKIMTEENKKINIQMFNWGPCVIRMKISDEFKKLLLSEAKKNKIDFKDKLAGILESETGYSEESKKIVLPQLSQCLGIYNQAYVKHVNKPFDKQPEYILASMWINHQKQYEFNPPHDHDGKLSFVTYLSIPEELKENSEYKGKSCGPGGIQFMYGDGIRDCVTIYSIFPEENDMFIFPAWLKHWVAPYKSDVTRISVSGNVHDSAPLNNIVDFNKHYIGNETLDKKKGGNGA